MLLDRGPVPGSYGWVFPKDDELTVGVMRKNHDRHPNYILAAYITSGT